MIRGRGRTSLGFLNPKEYMVQKVHHYIFLRAFWYGTIVAKPRYSYCLWIRTVPVLYRYSTVADYRQQLLVLFDLDRGAHIFAEGVVFRRCILRGKQQPLCWVYHLKRLAVAYDTVAPHICARVGGKHVV